MAIEQKKILGIVASMKKNGNTNTLVNHCIDSIKHFCAGIESEIIYTSDYSFKSCKVVCSEYCSQRSFECAINDDVDTIFNKMINADAIIIGAPLYVRIPPSHFHVFVERLISRFFFSEMNELKKVQSPLDDKPCGLIAVSEYSNPHQILEYLNDFCLLLKMKPITLKKFPYLGVSAQGDITNDQIFKPFELSQLLAERVAMNLIGEKDI